MPGNEDELVGLEPVGTVAELWRYPVKSMQGEQLSKAELLAGGLTGDRAWAIVDRADGRIVSAKTEKRLLDATAITKGGTSSAGTVEIRLPDGTLLSTDDREACDSRLSEWLGRPVGLQPAGGDTGAVYQMTFDPPNDDADLVDIPPPAGTWFDLAGIHLLSTGSLATTAAAHPDGAWIPRRFRPNVVVDTGGADGYPEDAWVDHPLLVGGARLNVLMRTVRCAIPLRAQPAHAGEEPLARDVGIFRTLAALHDNHLGTYADVTAPGPIAVGDPVHLEA